MVDENNKKDNINQYKETNISFSEEYLKEYSTIKNKLCSLENKIYQNKLNNTMTNYQESLVEQSEFDSRNIRYLKFESNFQILLVEDSRTDKSAAAMNVQIGSYLDPPNFRGLAHFLEHMLFMGTDLFPGENDFEEFLSQAYGYSNAFTADENTVYYYLSNNKFFKEALLRFSRFFIAPLFNESSVNREVKAVDSEYCDSKTEDSWRLSHLKSQEKNPSSVENCFGMGCKKTLIKDDLRKEVMNFYYKYYKSNKMILTLVSKFSIDYMKAMVFEIFSEMFADKSTFNTNNNININNNLTTTFEVNVMKTNMSLAVEFDNITNPPYSNELDNLNQIYYVKPSSSINSISIDWIIFKNHFDLYKSPPLGFITTVLGHENKNSVAFLLKKLDLITELSAFYKNNTKVYSTFSINLKMTSKGFDNWELVVCLIYAYIEYFKQNKVNERFLEEFKTQFFQTFSYDDNISNDISEIAVDLAEAFSNHSYKDVITKDYLFYGKDVGKIKEFFNYLDYNNINIYFSSKRLNFSNTKFSELKLTKEKWYGVKFCKNSIPSSLISKWKSIVDCLFKNNKINKGIESENSLFQCINNNEFLELINKDNFEENENFSIEKIKSLYIGAYTEFDYPDKNEFISYNMSIKDYQHFKVAKNEKHNLIVSDNHESILDIELLSTSTINNQSIESKIHNNNSEKDKNVEDITSNKNIFPELIKDSTLSKVYFKQDYTFNLPKLDINCKIHLDVDKIEYIKYKNIFKLLLDLLEEELTDLTYLASDAEISLHFGYSHNGLSLNVSGFNDKIKFFINKYLKEFILKIDEMKKNLKDEKYINSKLKTKIESTLKDKKIDLSDRPDEQARNLLNHLLFKKSTWINDDIKFLEEVYNNKMDYDNEDDDEESNSSDSDEEKSDKNSSNSKDEDSCEEEDLEESLEKDEKNKDKNESNNKNKLINPIKTDIIIEVLDLVFQKANFLWLIQGNITVLEAKEITQISEEIILSLFPKKNLVLKEKYKTSILALPQQVEFIYEHENNDKEEENYSTLCYYQTETSCLKETLTMGLINSVLPEWFFNSLRTKQQIGYSVSAYIIKHNQFRGFAFLVQSNKLNSEEIDKRINLFIQEFYEELKLKGNEFFQKYVESMIAEYSNRFNSLDQEVDFNWSLLLNDKEEDFNIKNQKIETLKKGIDKDLVIELYEKVFIKEIRKITLYVKPNKAALDKILKSKAKEKKEIKTDDLVNNKNNSNLVEYDANKELTPIFLAKKRVKIPNIEDFKKDYLDHFKLKDI